MTQTKPTLSFEFFPPKTDKAAENLWLAVEELAALNPAFMTCTYGAGGSTRDKTLETTQKIHALGGVPTASHLTYINTPRQELYKLADEIWNSGIHHLIALRGDMPDDLNWPLDPDAEYFQYTSHFVAALKARQNFEISVGAYPEKHPDAPDLNADIEALKKKCDAGADRAITQFFFNNDSYYRFLDETAKFGIKKPVVPGILPIVSYQNMLRFAQTCKAHVPNWLKEKFESAPEDDHPKIAEEILITQLQGLTQNGAPHFHIYTLNKSELSVKACQALDITASLSS